MNDAPSAALMSRDLAERHVAARGQRDADLADRVEACAILRQPSHDQVEAAIAFQDLGHRLTADRRLHDRGDVADVEPIARARIAIGRDQQIGLAERAINPRVDDPRHLAHHLHRSRWRHAHRSPRSGPKTLTEFEPFTPDIASLMLSSIFCE